MGRISYGLNFNAVSPGFISISIAYGFHRADHANLPDSRLREISPVEITKKAHKARYNKSRTVAS